MANKTRSLAMKHLLLAIVISFGLSAAHIAHAATYTIPSTETTVDGNLTYSWTNNNLIQPGDKLLISANRNRIDFWNINGTASQPITITNGGSSQVVITNTGGGNGAIRTRKCEHIRITGTGAAGITYGLKLVGRQSPHSKALVCDGTRYFEVDFLEVTLTGIGSKTTSAKLADLGLPSNWVQYETRIHDNNIHDVDVEGMYIGGKVTQDGTPLNGVYIYNNIVTACVWDGIQLRNAHGTVKVYDNYIHTTGTDPRDEWGPDCTKENPCTFQTGAGLNPGGDSTAGDWYGNTVINARFGAAIGSNPSNISLYNNVFIDCGFETAWSYPEGAIQTTATNGKIYNNTIVNSLGFGILAKAVSSGRIDDNIIVGSAGTPIINDSSNMVVGANYVGTVGSVAFANAGADDFHLTGSSPSQVLDGGTRSTFPGTDLEGISRPQGASYDLGAYEFVSSAAPGVYDANALSIAASSGDSAVTVSNAGASGGNFLRYKADAVNDFITFNVSVPLTQTYQVTVRYQKYASHGICRLAIDGVNQGLAEDLYNSTVMFIDLDLGAVSLAAGTRAFKFKVTGKNASSSGRYIGIDTITLTPQ